MCVAAWMASLHNTYISIEYPIRERSGIIYSSIYQNRVPNKRKGSGVGLYIVPYISIEYPIRERNGIIYSSIYQYRVPNKRKGSGVGLYIHEKHIYTKLNAQSLITENIESIFVKISHPLGDIVVGVIYRPPGGNLNIFNSELSSIMSSFRESEKIFIMGNFNINLFHNNASVKLFEETFICNGFNPVISTATHC